MMQCITIAIRLVHCLTMQCILVLFHQQKIEVMDEDEEDDDYNVELMASDLEQMQSLLEFKVNAHRRAQLLAVMILSSHCGSREAISLE